MTLKLYSYIVRKKKKKKRKGGSLMKQVFRLKIGNIWAIEGTLFGFIIWFQIYAYAKNFRFKNGLGPSSFAVYVNQTHICILEDF